MKYQGQTSVFTGLCFCFSSKKEERRLLAPLQGIVSTLVVLLMKTNWDRLLLVSSSTAKGKLLQEDAN
ncbi:hypothetical protein R6Q57_004867 [Mikania cordata]